DVEHHHPVALVAHGAAQVQGALGVVAGGGGEATGVVGVAVVQVAVDDDLEGHLHGFGVHRAEAGEAVVRGEVHAGTVVGVRDEELAVAEHVLGVRHLLQAQAVDGLDVRDADDLVRLHDVQTDTSDAGVGLVVDEQVLAVVAAVGHRDVRVVAVPVREVLTHDLLAFVGDAPAGGRVGVEHRDTHQLAHRGNAQHAHFTLVTTRPEAVVLVQFTGRHMHLVLGLLDGLRPGLAGHHRATEGGRRHGGAGYGAGAEEATTAQTALHFLFVLLVAHGVSLLWVQHFALSRTLRMQASGFSHLYSGNQLGVRSGLPAALLALVDQRRTLVVVVVGHLAIEAVVALVVVDVTIRVDRLDLAFHGAQLAGVATLLATLEPVEQAELAGHRQGRAERADVAAVDL